MNDQAQERVREAVKRLIRMFDSGDMPRAVAQTVINRQAGDLPSSQWSLGNQLLMLMADTTDARGFNQWKEVGRFVKKGAQAIYILAPVTRKVPAEEEDGNEKVVPVGFTTVPVFRYEDTDGTELKRPDYNPPALPPLYEVAQVYGVKVAYGPSTQRLYGYYHISSNSIMLCSHDVSVFFHELAHAVHNRVRPLKGGQDAAQEIVAETCAAVLCLLYGYEGYVYSASQYIAAYAGSQNPARAVLQVIADVEKVLNLILAAEGGATRQR